MSLERLLSSSEVCEILGCSLKTLQGYCRKRLINFLKIPPTRLGKNHFTQAAVAEFIGRAMIAGQAADAIRNPKPRRTPRKRNRRSQVVGITSSSTAGEAASV